MLVNSVYKVSVIVPVYNVEQYLPACLESICNQTLKEIEIIVVNDGSIDNSLSIIRLFQQKYSNIKLINKKNGGLSSARNAGIEKAVGEYLFFVDSDDFIDLNTLEEMYVKAKETHCPLIICGILQYWSDNKKKLYKKCISDKESIYDADFLYKLQLTGRMGCQCWNKLYKRDVWMSHSLRFREGKYYEDIDMAFRVVKAYRKAYIINEALYKYRMRLGSIVATPSVQKIKDFVDNTRLAISIVTADLYPVADRLLEQFKINSLVYSFELLHKLGGSKELEKYISENIKFSSNFCVLMMSDTIPVRLKIKYFLYVLLYPIIE